MALFQVTKMLSLSKLSFVKIHIIERILLLRKDIWVLINIYLYLRDKNRGFLDIEPMSYMYKFSW